MLVREVVDARRRSTDVKPRLKGAVKVGAIGLGVFALSRWAWNRLRARPSTDQSSG